MRSTRHFTILVSLLLVSIFTVGCASKPSSNELATADFGSYPDNYKATIENHVRGILKDPDSMRDFVATPPLKGFFQRNTYADKVFGYISMVQVNAKNSFGGYTGTQHYVALLVNGSVDKLVKAENTSTKTGFYGAFGQGRYFVGLVDDDEIEEAKKKQE